MRTDAQVHSIMTVSPGTVAPDTSLDEALELMDTNRIHHLPVVDGEEVVGVLSDRDLLRATGWLQSRVHACRGPRGTDLVPGKVEEVMTAPVKTIGPLAPIAEAAAVLVSMGFGCLPVVDENGLVGILTERDLAQAVAGDVNENVFGRAPEDAVSKHMTEHPTTVSSTTELADLHELFSTNRIRHAPVIENERLIGVVSDRDLRCAMGVGRRGELPVHEMMSEELVTVAPTDSLRDAARTMAERGVSSVLVVDGKELIGILTSTDLVAVILDGVRSS